MSTVLRIDASSRLEGSHSRDLGDHFQTRWLATHPDDRFTIRDLAVGGIEQIQQSTITGFYTPEEQMSEELKTATRLSDALIAELKSTDILLLTTPMYNFTVPAALKAWIDQIVRIGHTFAYDGSNFEGLLETKHAYVMCAYGADGYLERGPLASANFLQPYLSFLFGFLGINQVDFVSQVATTADETTVAENVTQARSAIDELVG